MAALPKRRPGTAKTRTRAATPVNPLAAKRVLALLSRELGPDAWERAADNEAAAVGGWIAGALLSHDAAKDGPLVMYRAADGERLGHLLVAVQDQPFLTDTVRMALARTDTSMVRMAHPVVNVVKDGKTLQLRTMEGSRRGPKTALIYAQVRRPDDDGEALLDAVKAGVEASVRAVSDFNAMTDLLEKVMGQQSQRVGKHDRECVAFMRWLLAGNFVFLGYRHYRYAGNGRDTTVQATPGSGMGLFAQRASNVAKETKVATLGASLQGYLREPGWLVLSKTPEKSVVHRPAALDYVAVLERDDTGQVVGEHRWVGLYTSQAMTAHVREIPLVRQKVAAVLAAAPWSRHGHTYRALVNVLETYARDELLLTPAEALLRIAGVMAKVQEYPEPRLLVRAAPREQAVSCYVLLPLGKNNTDVRGAIRDLLMHAFGGYDCDFRAELNGDNELARLFFRIRTQVWPPQVDENALEAQVKMLVTGWEERFRDALETRFGLALGEDLWLRHKDMGDDAYRTRTTPEEAVDDVDILATTLGGSGAFHLRGRVGTVGLVLRVYREGNRWPLASLVPLLSSFGLDVDIEEPHCLQADGVMMWVHVLTCSLPRGVRAEDASARLPALMEAVQAGLGATDEQDNLSSLVMAAGLSRFDVVWLRALVAYLQQVQAAFHPAVVRGVLLAHPALAGALVTLARARFQPDFSRAARQRMEHAAEDLWKQGMDAVATNAEERVLMALWHVVQAMVRTNAWQRVDEDEALAFKLDPQDVPELPQPLPWREIFVYHPSVEGVHLRGGPVARGGLRHSDRRQDYRTEVLALMDAQVKKNAIIVPTGAKGGFYIKATLPEAREAQQEAIRACYQRYVRALLSVSDTLFNGETIAPRGVLRRDGDDPYLVVAADKGTATFSDLANATAIEADFWDGVTGGFWLGDAFASGGSQGYDHKDMGITARGAWVSVMHHAGQLGILPTPERPLVMVGIGDMGGDVFGNGLLLDKNVKLVAAFNHKHIFIDPNPDPAVSFAERKRLFEARLGWDGYDKDKLGKGGGIYLRTAKSVDLGKDARKLLDLPAGPLETDDVIRAILKADVDCLWNGGIGTYIKASLESHAAANDKTNDAVRVDGKAVRARIIGEGGNLGITTMGRVELAMKGVQLNTDALDNSAGVDTSDHEVNLKILLKEAEARGWLTRPQRNSLMAKATEDVASLVLSHNRAQNWAITLAVTAPESAHLALQDWQQELAKMGLVEPKREGLPKASELAARKDRKYTRPELCILLAATKRALRAAVANAAWLCDEALNPWVESAFPARIKDAFKPEQWRALLAAHPLRATLAEMAVVNVLVNRLGLTQAASLRGENALDLAYVVQALVLAVDIAGAQDLWAELDAHRVAPGTSRAAGIRIRQALAQLAGWLLMHPQPLDMALWRKLLCLPDGLVGLGNGIPTETAAMVKERVKGWREDGLPAALSGALGHAGLLVIWPEAVMLAKDAKVSPNEAMRMLVTVSEALHLPKLNQHVRRLEEGTGWDRQAVAMLVQELLTRQRQLAMNMLKAKVQPDNVAEALPEHVQGWRRYQALVGSLGRKTPMDVAQLTVLVGRLRVS